ncbi:hypothetical protein SprV_0301251400 [Sparganum proliferum]
MRLKRVGAKTQPCFIPLVTANASETAPFPVTRAIIVKLTHYLGESPGTVECLHDSPQSFAIHRGKGFRPIHKVRVEVDLHLLTFLLQLAGEEDHVGGAAMMVFVELSRDRVRSGPFSAGKLLHGPGGFVERAREVEAGFGLHFRQTGDDGVGDGGRTVEDASARPIAGNCVSSCDDETMVGPPCGTRNSLCYQRVPLVSPPDEDIVQQMPVSRPRVHPGGLLWHREAEVCVGQDEPVF